MMKSLAALDGPMLTVKPVSESQVGHQRPYSVCSLFAVGLAENGLLFPADGRLRTALPGEDPRQMCTWLVAGVGWCPCREDASYVPDPGLTPPLHSMPSYTEMLEKGIGLSPASKELASRLYLTLLRYARAADPRFWKQGFQLGFAHPTAIDPFYLPTEGFFFLLASLEWLGQILMEDKLPASTYFAWVGISAPPRPREPPVGLAP